MTNKDEKKEPISKLDECTKVINKTFGENSVVRLNDYRVLNKDVLHTGSLGVDDALGGGVLRGRIVELFGPESSGKTTLAIHFMVEAQKDRPVLFMDLEHSFDALYAQKLGVNLDHLLVSQPDTAEQAFEIIEALVSTGEISLMVLDSVAGLSPRAELEGDSGSSNMGLTARLLGQHIRKVKGEADKNKTTLLYINQLRAKLAVMFGSNETTTGGNALKFFASARLDIRRIKTNKKDDVFESITSRVKVVKNKMSIPLKIAEFIINFGTGIDTDREIVDMSLKKGLLKKSGSWFSYNDENIAQGADNAAIFIKENPEIKEELLKKIKE